MRQLSQSEQEIFDLATRVTAAIPDGTELGLVLSVLGYVIEGSLSRVPPIPRAKALYAMSRRFADTADRLADRSQA